MRTDDNKTSLELLGNTKSQIVNQIKKFFTDTVKGISEEQSTRLAEANFIMWESIAKTLAKKDGPQAAINFMRSKLARIGIISTAEVASGMGVAKFAEDTNDALKDVESTAKALEGVDETQLISGEDVWNNATKAGSENNDFIENTEEYEGQIKGRQYLKVPISIDLLRANDKDLNEYLNDIDTSVKKRKIETPIIVGDAERGAFETTKDGVIDGFHRAEQAIINGEKNIIAFVPINSKIISEAYHKAKSDGANPELVKAVEDLLGKPTEQPKETIPNVEAKKADIERRRQEEINKHKSNIEEQKNRVEQDSKKTEKVGT